MGRASERIPVEIWREIFLRVFAVGSSSSSLTHILDTHSQHPSEKVQISPYVLLCRYLSPIIEEILFTQVFLRASHCENFLVAATTRNGGGGLKSRGHHCKILTIYGNNGVDIDISRLSSACPRLQRLRIEGYHGLSLKTDGKFMLRPPSESIQTLLLGIEGLTWDNLQFVSLHFPLLRQLRIVKWSSTNVVNGGNDLILPYLTHLSITEAFSATVDAAYLHLPSLVHLGVEVSNPVGTMALIRYLARHGKNVHTLDFRCPHRMPQYHFLYQHTHQFLSYCPVVETLLLSYPITYSSIEYQPADRQIGRIFVQTALRRLVITGFDRYSEPRFFRDLGQHFSRETFPGIQTISIALSITKSSEASHWIIQEAQNHFYSTGDGTIQIESIILPYL
jgi:hypothetical protein